MAERRLGRGLGALLGSASPTREAMRAIKEPPPADLIQEIPVQSIVANTRQPRQTFDLETISELGASLKAVGQISPILVQRLDDDGFELIAGERRLRAAKEIGWVTIKAIVRPVNEEQKLEIALIENIQREDLNPIDRAQALSALVQEFQLTHERVSERVGMSRPTLTNLLRLLELPDDLREQVRGGQISAGHGRALLAVEGDEAQRALADTVQLEGLSVRALEKKIKDLKGSGTSRAGKKGDKNDGRRSPQVREMEQRVARLLGTKVRISPRDEGGRILIDYFSTDDFERIYRKLHGE